jgi:hypothetical protein
MQGLAKARWLLLGAALVCGILAALPWVYAPSVNWNAALEWAALAAGLLQAIGTFATTRAPASAALLWVIVSYAAAVIWVVVHFAGVAAVEAGPGGLVYGLLIMMPGTGLALLLQFVALIGFSRRR